MNNTGYVVNIRDGIGLNNLTIVANTAGVQFEAPNAQGYIANSIVIGNPNGTNNNCQFSSDDKSILQITWLLLNVEAVMPIIRMNFGLAINFSQETVARAVVNHSLQTKKPYFVLMQQQKIPF